ncbi:hypothetical protein B7P43_G07014 [Cryptotermes secundus]|uniref:Uncharacterized protein n=2 Tax=Cryptotermes secundus TaxID=105785 RepID=A0A2J7PEP7_9NEOP|nr:hypothetical protein B7P43_G07014 [Cryptotermes secundus]
MFERLTNLLEHSEAVSKSMDNLWNMILEANNGNHETRSMSINAFGAADIKFQDLSYKIRNMEERISALKQLQTMPKPMPFHRVPAIIPLQQMATPLQFQLPGTSDAKDAPASTNAGHSTTVTDASHGPTSTDASHGPTSTDTNHGPTSTEASHGSTSTNATNNPASTNASHDLRSTSNLYANKKNMRAEGQNSGARRDHC